MAAIALIVGNTGDLDANYEVAYRDRMVNTLGHTVTYIDDSAAEATDYSSYDMIFISLKCAPASVDGLKTEATPIIFIEELITDNFGFGDEGAAGNEQDAIEIIDNTHYITTGFSTGDVIVYNPNARCKYFINWSNDVNDLAADDESSSWCVLAEIDSGETLSDSSSAAERRVWFGLYRSQDYHANGYAWDLFDNSVGWLLYEDGIAGNYDLSANVTIQNKSQADLSANVTIRNKGQYDLSSNVTIQNKAQTDLSSNVTIQNKSQTDLSVNVTIQNQGSYDLSANVTIQNQSQADLSANTTIQNQGSYDLSANFLIGTADYGYVVLGDAIVHNIVISDQTHNIKLSDQVHVIKVSSEPLN